MLVALVPGYFFTALTVDCMGHRVLQVSVCVFKCVNVYVSEGEFVC